MAHGPTSAAIVAKEFAIPADKMRVIKHGHWIDYHRRGSSATVARELLKVDADRYVYTFVGACKPYKNLELLIESFARLTDNSVLVIAGHFPSESYREHIEALLKRLPAQRWRLHAGFIADEDVHRYVLAGNVLVLPYAEILTSGSAMLGLSFGRPVIAPNAGGLRDMVTAGCGLLYEPTQANGLLDALQRIRALQFSEDQIVLQALSFKWTDAAMAIATLLWS
jgi:glycosyltransferase involved in cell wall biosynthesis